MRRFTTSQIYAISGGGKLDDEPYLSSPNYEVDGTLDLINFKVKIVAI